MNLYELERRFKRIEARFQAVGRFLLGDRLRIVRRILGLLVLAGLAAGAVLYTYRYDQMKQARIERVDVALASDYPSYESAFCRWIYGNNPAYDECLRNEQASFAKFEAAWRRDESVSDLREHMIACFNGARNEGGVSWKAAAECSELDADEPDAPAH